jgi:hypothetical protein
VSSSATLLRPSGGVRRSRPAPSLDGLPSASLLALGFGAFIIPVDGFERILGVRLSTSGPDIASLLGLPDFLRGARAFGQRRAGTEFPDVQSVLGQQETLGELGNGGSLTFGHLPLLALALVFFSSLLVVGAVLPPGVVARTPVSPVRYEHLREPLALAAIGILLPVAIVALATALG